MSTINKLESDTFAGKTIQAWKDQAREAGLVLRAPSTETDAGDFPERLWFNLRRFRRNISITQNHKKIVTHMARQLISERDEKGKPTKTEYLTYIGYYSGTTRKGGEYHADYEIGKYQKPRIVHNSDVRYDAKTGDPIGSEKILSGSDVIWTIEVPKDKAARKKLIDSIIGDNFPEDIKFYFKGHDELARRDSTFSYEEFVSCSIQELRNMSFKGGGSLASGIWRDPKDGKLKDRDGTEI